MTYPNTQKSEASYGGPPEYPTSTFYPKEYWRKEKDADPNATQHQTIEISPGVFEKRLVEPGWDNPVVFGGPQ